MSVSNNIMTVNKKLRKNICINCYNQHGCLTDEPLCLLLKREDTEKFLTGKKLMEGRGLLKDCQKCSHFRLCWTGDAYRKSVRK